MSEAHQRAVALAQHYFRQIAEQAGVNWDGDNDVEVELMVGYIIDAAAAPLRGQLDDALGRIRQLEGQTPQAQRLELEADLAAADLAESGDDGCICCGIGDVRGHRPECARSTSEYRYILPEDYGRGQS